ncbi:DUF4194 domain-containing protein [Alloalcanivorax sp. C16-1]|uniref:DUF4194 domain-containing protein n=1 Tax=Alloalcanivorax sp. C16-1 TaxID=3390051 RepID=UPI003970C0B2
MTLRHALNDALDAQGVTPAQFSELMIRLLDRGVLCRDESKKEAELYDRYLRIPELVEDYLSVLRVRLHHERRFASVRLFPPGAEVPGQPDQDDSAQGGLRQRLSQQEVALILVLRAEYDKCLRDGQIDEHGQATLPLEALNLASKNLLGRPLPDGSVEREALFRRLRQLRLIRGAGDAGLADSEAWLTIRPGITGLVTDAVLATLTDEREDPQPCT